MSQVEKLDILIELHYLPCLEYFVILQQAEKIIIEGCEHFQKQTYRNRCAILGANKVQILSIPVQKGSKKFKDIKIDYRQNWLKDHWKSIVSAYGKAPFFEYYRDGFEEIFFKKEKFLFDLNLKLLTKCLKLLGMDQKIFFTKSYDTDTEKGVRDCRSKILVKESFKERPFYKAITYNQIFGKGFAGNLSIIDLLFCEGPQSSSIICMSKETDFEFKGI